MVFIGRGIFGFDTGLLPNTERAGRPCLAAAPMR